MPRRKDSVYNPLSGEQRGQPLYQPPETAAQACMEAAPHTDPRVSTQEMLPIRDVLSDALDRLPALDRWVFERCIIEKMPLRRIAEMTGLPKSTIHDLKLETVRTLRSLLSDHPQVREYFADR